MPAVQTHCTPGDPSYWIHCSFNLGPLDACLLRIMVCREGTRKESCSLTSYVYWKWGINLLDLLFSTWQASVRDPAIDDLRMWVWACGIDTTPLLYSTSLSSPVILWRLSAYFWFASMDLTWYILLSTKDPAQLYTLSIPETTRRIPVRYLPMKCIKYAQHMANCSV